MTYLIPPPYSQPLKTVILNGSLHKPSRTRILLDAVNNRLAKNIMIESQFIELADLVPHIGSALSTENLAPVAKKQIENIEKADLLIVGSPVYRGNIPGLLKHLFDLITMEALTGKPVLLVATGGSQRHSLVIDHQLRPLFAFFQALTLPIGVYGTPEEIIDGQISSELLSTRIDQTIRLALPVLTNLTQNNYARLTELQEI